jgi:hypothetical protein
LDVPALDLAGWLTAYHAELETYELFDDAPPDPEWRTFLKTNPQTQENWDSLPVHRQKEARVLLVTGASKFRIAMHTFRAIETHAAVGTSDAREKLQNSIDSRNESLSKLRRHYGFFISADKLEEFGKIHGNPHRDFPSTSFRLTEDERNKKLQPAFRTYLAEFIACFKNCPETLVIDATSDDFKRNYALYLLFSDLAEQQHLIDTDPLTVAERLKRQKK